ncbi:MAG: hypothetical protein Q8L26_00025 [Candidatus Omnitrophota bacterium]|nr:hypothetical protein [Candidatus Omnitrophota bacterium]
MNKVKVILMFCSIFLTCLARFSLADNTLWVIDRASNELIRLSEDNPSERATTAGFNAAKSLIINKNDASVWIADTFNNRVMQISSDGKTKLYIIDDEIGKPFHIAISSTHRVLWIANSSTGEVTKFSLNEMKEIGRIGGFSNPHDIVISPYDDSVWVSDSDTGEIVRLFYDGSILSRAKFKGFKPDHLTINPNDGTCWVTTHSKLIARISSDGKKVLSKLSGFGLPFMIITDREDGSSWVSDPEKGELIKVSPEGKIIKIVDSFNHCFGLSEINLKDKAFWTADAGSGEIIRVSSEGKILARIGGFREPFMIAAEK